MFGNGRGIHEYSNTSVDRDSLAFVRGVDSGGGTNKTARSNKGSENKETRSEPRRDPKTHFVRDDRFVAKTAPKRAGALADGKIEGKEKDWFQRPLGSEDRERTIKLVKKARTFFEKQGGNRSTKDRKGADDPTYGELKNELKATRDELKSAGYSAKEIEKFGEVRGLQDDMKARKHVEGARMKEYVARHGYLGTLKAEREALVDGKNQNKKKMDAFDKLIDRQIKNFNEADAVRVDGLNDGGETLGFGGHDDIRGDERKDLLKADAKKLDELIDKQDDSQARRAAQFMKRYVLEYQKHKAEADDRTKMIEGEDGKGGIDKAIETARKRLDDDREFLSGVFEKRASDEIAKRSEATRLGTAGNPAEPGDGHGRTGDPSDTSSDSSSSETSGDSEGGGTARSDYQEFLKKNGLAQKNGRAVYEVQKGDNLSSIQASEFYQPYAKTPAWNGYELYQYGPNQKVVGADPNQIDVGQQIYMPQMTYQNWQKQQGKQ